MSRKTMQSVVKGLQRSRLIGANLGNRDKDDFYTTPPSATEALIAAERFNGAVWEPACGNGAITKVLQARGFEVRSTDLVDRGFGTPHIDFLMENGPTVANIITNPPFKLASQFARHALKWTSSKVALLLKVGFLEGKERADLFDAAPFARLWVFRARQTFLRGGDVAITMNGAGGMIAYGWFVWDHAHSGSPTLGWL